MMTNKLQLPFVLSLVVLSKGIQSISVWRNFKILAYTHLVVTWCAENSSGVCLAPVMNTIIKRLSRFCLPTSSHLPHPSQSQRGSKQTTTSLTHIFQLHQRLDLLFQPALDGLH